MSSQMSNNLKGQMSSNNGQHDANSGHQTKNSNTNASGAYNELPGEEISTPPPAAPNTIHKTLGAYNVLHEGSDQAKTAEDTEPSGEENITTPPGA